MQLPVLTSAQRARAIVVVLGGTGVPVALAVAASSPRHLLVHLVGALIALLVPLLVVSAGARRPVLRYAGALAGPPGITLLQAHEGGVASSAALLLVLPAIWFGVQGSAAELRLGAVVLVVCCFGPMLVVGAPAYPVDWASAALVTIVVGAVAGALAIVTREVVRTTSALRRAAKGDALTGLLNRRGWHEHAGRELARVRRRGGAVTLVAVDLDAFKAVNDERGHDAGDRVLLETAKRLRAAFRTEDVVARLGGDEFGVLLVDTDVEQATRALDRLREATPADGDFSAGVADADGTEPLEAVLRRADRALYAAKRAGRGRTALAARAGAVPR